MFYFYHLSHCFLGKKFLGFFSEDILDEHFFSNQFLLNAKPFLKICFFQALSFIYQKKH